MWQPRPQRSEGTTELVVEKVVGSHRREHRYSRVNAARRRYPIEGTWERYSFRIGNVLFLMMSDINEPSRSVGRDTLAEIPAVVVSGETFEWWKKMVEANAGSIIVSAHHYMLKNTTVASGDGKGCAKGPTGNGKAITTAIRNRARRRRFVPVLGEQRARCAGVRAVSRGGIPGQSPCGSAATLTPIPTTPTAARATSRQSGAFTSSMSAPQQTPRPKKPAHEPHPDVLRLECGCSATCTPATTRRRAGIQALSAA